MNRQNNNNNNNSSSSSIGSKAQQQQQIRKDKTPLISRFVVAFKSKCITLQKQRAQGILIIQEEFRDYLKRMGSHIHVSRQQRKEQRRHFLIGVDRIIRAAVENGRIICMEEVRDRRELFFDWTIERMSDLIHSELRERDLFFEDEEEEREKLVELLLANVPRDVVPGTFEYEEFQDRCHVLRLENFQRNLLVHASIAPKAGIIHQLQNSYRSTIRMDELEERIDILRQCQSGVAEIQMFELERVEERLRPQIEEERDIAYSGMQQFRALTGLYLLLGPGEGSEHDTRIDLYLEQEEDAHHIFQRMWEERTLLGAQFLLVEEKALRTSRRGIPALEEHERCQIVSKLYMMKLMLLQGEFSANDGLYTSSEAGSRRAIRWQEGRARDDIYQAAAATLHVALVPIEESRRRDTIRKSEDEQAILMIQKVPLYYQHVLEPGARRGIFREWVSWARSITFGMFSVTLQAIEESHRTFLRNASVIELELLAGAEYLEFLEKKHRRLITREMSSRSIVAAAAKRDYGSRNRAMQALIDDLPSSNTLINHQHSSPSSLSPHHHRSASRNENNNTYYGSSSPTTRRVSGYNNNNNNKTNADFYSSSSSPSSTQMHHRYHVDPNHNNSSSNYHHDYNDYDDDDEDYEEVLFTNGNAVSLTSSSAQRRREQDQVPPFVLKAASEMSPPRNMIVGPRSSASFGARVTSLASRCTRHNSNKVSASTHHQSQPQQRFTSSASSNINKTQSSSSSIHHPNKNNSASSSVSSSDIAQIFSDEIDLIDLSPSRQKLMESKEPKTNSSSSMAAALGKKQQQQKTLTNLFHKF